MAGRAADAGRHDDWGGGGAYESYMGRWSARLAERFVAWLRVPPGQRWLDVGCGTGALSGAILDACGPSAVVGIEPSDGLRAAAAERLPDSRFTVVAGDAADLATASPPFDAVVSNLVLNFVPRPPAIARVMLDATSPGGLTAACVWDYAGGLEFVRLFWDVASSLDNAAAELDEGKRFPLCAPGPLGELFTEAGFVDVETDRITIPTVFHDFDDFWEPFTLGQGPAPGYVTSLPPDRRERLRRALMDRAKQESDGRVVLEASAWAVRGTRSEDS
jgi:trans-aconitate methyltransferase